MKSDKINEHERHIKTRKALRELPEVSDLEFILDHVLLSKEDKMIIRMIYLEGRDINYISDTLGFSASVIKTRHRKALNKMDVVMRRYF